MKDILEILRGNFPDQKFELETDNYGGSIHAFFIESDTEEILNNSWEKIRNMVGVYFQSALDSEFEIWNIYLLFITPIGIHKDLRHKIEHDTMSSRKIVIDNNKKMNDTDFRKFLFSEHITNNNLKTGVVEKEKKPFPKNKLISQFVDEIELSKSKKNKEDVIGTALNKIETTLLKK